MRTRHRHDWRPDPAGPARYVCSTCGATGYHAPSAGVGGAGGVVAHHRPRCFVGQFHERRAATITATTNPTPKDRGQP